MNSFERCRREANLTQEKAAILLGLKTSSTISMWETGKNVPGARMLVKIASAYGCSIDELLREDEKAV